MIFLQKFANNRNYLYESYLLSSQLNLTPKLFFLQKYAKNLNLRMIKNLRNFYTIF